MPNDLIIRPAREEDAGALLEIYAPYVTDTAISFEYEVPTLEEFRRRIRETLKTYPYLVAQIGDTLAGYAYASAFKPRAAYQWSVETTIYLRRDLRGQGLGRKLYQALEETLRAQNILNLNACIAHTGQPDSYLSNGSEAFHDRMGYKKVAHFTKCGYKFNTWYDMIWMEKIIGDHPVHPASVIPFSQICHLWAEAE